MDNLETYIAGLQETRTLRNEGTLGIGRGAWTEKLHMGLVLMAVLVAALSGTYAHGANRVKHTVSDSIVEPGLPKFIMRHLGNTNGKSVEIGFDLISPEPFSIFKVEWENGDSIRNPIEPFTLVAHADTVTEKAIEWHILLEFPYTTAFNSHDKLRIHTDKGIITRYTMEEGRLKAERDELKTQHKEYVEKTEDRQRTEGILTIAGFAVLLAGGIGIYTVLRKRIERRESEIGELSMMVRERADINIDLRNKVNALYRSRLDTLNMLCDAYFNNKDSEKTKQLFYRDVEKSILSLRDDKSLGQLEGIVNEYLDDTIARVRRQIPELSISDLKFLTYLYAGFSPRAVCIFMDIKMKTFYNRRNLIKERILASDAPDKERFVSLMAI